MKPLLKILLVLASVFASTFLIAKFAGVLTVEQIEGWLRSAKELSPLYVGSIVFLLLFADLFIAVPTLTITILAGYFLGFPSGALAALLGTMTAGAMGYSLSHRFGEKILGLITKDPQKIAEAKTTFQQHGFIMILLSRAVPILPEVTACLAGMTRMPFARFILVWSISTAPYVLIATYAGSVSSLEKPMPAILAAIGISGTLWLAWFAFHRVNKRTQ